MIEFWGQGIPTLQGKGDDHRLALLKWTDVFQNHWCIRGNENMGLGEVI